jgi:hypothetical protein
MEAISAALEDALRSQLREFPQKPIQFVQGLHARNGGINQLAVLRAKGHGAFSIFFRDKMFDVLPDDIDSCQVSDVSGLAGSAKQLLNVC